MAKILAAAVLCLQLLAAQPVSSSSADEHWRALRFLEGSWNAKTTGGTAGIDSTGVYTFRRELGGHVLARHTSAQGCKGPVDADCDHTDLLYIYQDAAGQPLKAIYFDNEGHVIHYAVSTPAPARAELVSDPAAPGPQFRIVYELKGAAMEGKFQMRMPGQAAWNSYLEWSGTAAAPAHP